MPRESLTAKKVRGLEILNRLKQMYPGATCSLDYETPLQLMIATMLAAQCTDERVNKVTPALFARYKTVEDFATADLTELETLVKSTGFYRNKAKNIRLACQRIVEVFGGGSAPDNGGFDQFGRGGAQNCKCGFVECLWGEFGFYGRYPCDATDESHGVYEAPGCGED